MIEKQLLIERDLFGRAAKPSSSDCGDTEEEEESEGLNILHRESSARAIRQSQRLSRCEQDKWNPLFGPRYQLSCRALIGCSPSQPSL